MKNKDNKNENTGIISILILIILGVFSVYYYFSQRPPSTVPGVTNTEIPLEAPSPSVLEPKLDE
ncbi:MAG TPA: hypothetical protein PK657_04395 [Legionella sp.]|nr:hypothetical protein [Legionella sp.]